MRFNTKLAQIRNQILHPKLEKEMNTLLNEHPIGKMLPKKEINEVTSIFKNTIKNFL